MRTRLGRQVPTRVPPSLYIEGRTLRGVVSGVSMGYPQEAAAVDEGRHARVRDLRERRGDIVVADQPLRGRALRHAGASDHQREACIRFVRSELAVVQALLAQVVGVVRVVDDVGVRQLALGG